MRERKDTVAPRPWYRHVWPWLLMLPPLSAMIFWGVILSTMAGPPALVVDDYAKIGLSYAEDRSRDAAAVERGVSARLHAERAGGRFSLHLQGIDAPPESLHLRLSHPLDAARDRNLRLTRNAAGIYQGDIGEPLSGRHRVQLEPADRTWRLSGELAAGAEELRLEPKKSTSAAR